MNWRKTHLIIEKILVSFLFISFQFSSGGWSQADADRTPGSRGRARRALARLAQPPRLQPAHRGPPLLAVEVEPRYPSQVRKAAEATSILCVVHWQVHEIASDEDLAISGESAALEFVLHSEHYTSKAVFAILLLNTVLQDLKDNYYFRGNIIWNYSLLRLRLDSFFTAKK